ncbi:MAG: sulfatase-like hydrolase/transferase [Myxococcota bacterium]
MSDVRIARHPFWRRLLVVAVCSTVAIDAVLLAMGTGLVTGGFRGAIDRDPLDLPFYLLGAATLDTALILLVWLLAYPLFWRFGGGPIRCASLALILAVAPSALFAIASYRVHAILGSMVRARLLTHATSDLSTASTTFVEEWLPILDGLILIAVGGILFVTPLLARRLEARPEIRPIGPPSLPGLAVMTLATIGLGAAVLAIDQSRGALPRDGHARKASGQLLLAAIQLVTDWDRDGHGWLARPPDPDPFDAAIHPYATEIAGNGIDENGLAGDLPGDFVVETGPEPAPIRDGRRPDVLMIFLEGFRPELIDMEIDGAPVAPTLAALAREGTRFAHAYVHTPWTLQSRDQLFRGRLDEDHAGHSLVDDLIERGYFVAHFSGQDDSYGNSFADLGFDRARVFYDARQDLARRTSRSTMPASLQVSWKTLLERTLAFLDDYADETAPLFLFVNLVDTHFPYTHTELDALVAPIDLPRSEIRVENAERMFRTYANTAANVDHAIGRLLDAWRARFDGEESVFVVLSDHGESFYEGGTLGHGQSVEGRESRIPLIVKGLGGTWHEPIAISELRSLMLDRLVDEARPSGPEARIDPDKQIFQYLGKLASPERIALRGIEGTVVFDLLRGEGWKLGPDDERLAEAPTQAELDRVVWTWEIIQQRQRASTATP